MKAAILEAEQREHQTCLRLESGHRVETTLDNIEAFIRGAPKNVVGSAGREATVAMPRPAAEAVRTRGRP